MRMRPVSMFKRPVIEAAVLHNVGGADWCKVQLYCLAARARDELAFLPTEKLCPARTKSYRYKITVLCL